MAPCLHCIWGMGEGRLKNQKGYTLIELMVSIATLAILAGISLQSFVVLKERGYEVRASGLLNQAKIALSAGKVGGALEPLNFYWAWSEEPGAVEASGDGANFAPGFMNDEGFQSSLWLDMACDSGEWGNGCATEGGWVGHCRSGLSKSWINWRDGTNVEWEWKGAPWC